MSDNHPPPNLLRPARNRRARTNAPCRSRWWMTTATSLTTVSIALQAEGFATRLYSDGETALKALVENPPDLAVFDIKMPKMDGMELLRRLREHSPLPVIFLTSKNDESDEEAGLELGADDYIAKPFSPAPACSARIRAILRRADPVEAGTGNADVPEPAQASLIRGRLFIGPGPAPMSPGTACPVSLTVTEFLILEALAMPPRRDQEPQPADGCRLSRRCLRR